MEEFKYFHTPNRARERYKSETEESDHFEDIN